MAINTYSMAFGKSFLSYYLLLQVKNGIRPDQKSLSRVHRPTEFMDSSWIPQIPLYYVQIFTLKC